MKYRTFIELMNKYIRYAGQWHDEGCAAVFVDHGVCNCDTYLNAKTIKEKITAQTY